MYDHTPSQVEDYETVLAELKRQRDTALIDEKWEQATFLCHVIWWMTDIHFQENYNQTEPGI